MPTLNIDGVGRVTVSDDFTKLAPEQQQSIAEDIAQQVRAKGVAQDMDQSWGGAALTAVTNIPKSASQMAEAVAQPFIHPIDTATNIANLGKGVMQKLGILSGDDAVKNADAVGKFLVDRYGDERAIKRTLANDPVGMAADIAVVLTGGGAIAARAPGAIGTVARAAGTVGRAIDPVNLAVGGAKAAGYLGSAVTGGAGASRATARADVARALQRDDMTAEGAQAAGQAVSADRPGATLADVGGENTKGLMERVAQTPGAGRTTIVPFLTERQAQQMGRISTDLADLTGSNRTALQAVDETMRQRSTAATPLYQAAYQAGDKAVWSPELERLSSSPTVQSAMQGAVRIWRDNAIADGFGAMNPGAAVERGGQLSFLSGKVPVLPNIQFWDYTKRLIDDKVRGAIRAGQNQKARTLTRLAEQLRNDLDKQVPEYAAAREAWSGPTSYLDALETGRGILSRSESAEEMAAHFNSLSQVDRQGYREAAVSSIIGKMQGDPAKLADMAKYLRSDAMRKKVAAIMPNEKAAAAWERRLNFEVESSELVRRSLGGSATARRLAEMDDAGDLVRDLTVSTLSGHPSAGMWKVAVGAAKKIRDGLRSKVDQEIARIMSSPAALQNLPKALGGNVLPGKPLLPPLPYRGIARGAFQAGRAATIPRITVNKAPAEQ